MANLLLLNSAFFKNLSPLVTVDVVRNFLVPHLSSPEEILRIDFRYFPGSVQRYCQVDFKSSAGVTAATSLNGQSLLGVPIVASVIDPLSQAAASIAPSPMPSSYPTIATTPTVGIFGGGTGGSTSGVSSTVLSGLLNSSGQSFISYREPEFQQLNRTIHVANIPPGWDTDRLILLLSAHVKQLNRMTLIVTDKKLIEGLIPESKMKDRIALIEFKTSEMAEAARKLPAFARFVDGKELVISQAHTTVSPREPDNVSFDLPPSIPVPVAYQQLNKLKLQEKIARARALAQNIITSSSNKPKNQTFDGSTQCDSSSITKSRARSKEKQKYSPEKQSRQQELPSPTYKSWKEPTRHHRYYSHSKSFRRSRRRSSRSYDNRNYSRGSHRHYSREYTSRRLSRSPEYHRQKAHHRLHRDESYDYKNRVETDETLPVSKRHGNSSLSQQSSSHHKNKEKRKSISQSNSLTNKAKSRLKRSDNSICDNSHAKIRRRSNNSYRKDDHKHNIPEHEIKDKKKSTTNISQPITNSLEIDEKNSVPYNSKRKSKSPVCDLRDNDRYEHKRRSREHRKLQNRSSKDLDTDKARQIEQRSLSKSDRYCSTFRSKLRSDSSSFQNIKTVQLHTYENSTLKPAAEPKESATVNTIIREKIHYEEPVKSKTELSYEKTIDVEKEIDSSPTKVLQTSSKPDTKKLLLETREINNRMRELKEELRRTLKRSGRKT